MSEKPVVPPQDCHDMIDVRAGVDSIDAALVDLLKIRFGYMDAAARIKQDRGAVRDEARKTQVIDNVARFAKEADIPEGLVEQLWEILVETSIAHEFDEWDDLRS